MNRYSIDVSEPAKQDVLDTARYISAELSAPKAALDMVDKLDDGMRSLETTPNASLWCGMSALPPKDTAR